MPLRSLHRAIRLGFWDVQGHPGSTGDVSAAGPPGTCEMTVVCFKRLDILNDWPKPRELNMPLRSLHKAIRLGFGDVLGHPGSIGDVSAAGPPCTCEMTVVCSHPFPRPPQCGPRTARGSADWSQSRCPSSAAEAFSDPTPTLHLSLCLMLPLSRSWQKETETKKYWVVFSR